MKTVAFKDHVFRLYDSVTVTHGQMMWIKKTEWDLDRQMESDRNSELLGFPKIVVGHKKPHSKMLIGETEGSWFIDLRPELKKQVGVIVEIQGEGRLRYLVRFPKVSGWYSDKDLIPLIT